MMQINLFQGSFFQILKLFFRKRFLCLFWTRVGVSDASWRLWTTIRTLDGWAHDHGAAEHWAEVGTLLAFKGNA